MNRLTDNLVVYRPGDRGPIRTLGALENELRIVLASEDERRARIAEWLEHNTPEPMLLHQLRRSGYVRD